MEKELLLASHLTPYLLILHTSFIIGKGVTTTPIYNSSNLCGILCTPLKWRLKWPLNNGINQEVAVHPHLLPTPQSYSFNNGMHKNLNENWVSQWWCFHGTLLGHDCTVTFSSLEGEAGARKSRRSWRWDQNHTKQNLPQKGKSLGGWYMDATRLRALGTRTWWTGSWSPSWWDFGHPGCHSVESNLIPLLFEKKEKKEKAHIFLFHSTVKKIW